MSLVTKSILGTKNIKDIPVKNRKDPTSFKHRSLSSEIPKYSIHGTNIIE